MNPVNRFDIAASTWDDNPVRLELSKAVSSAMREALAGKFVKLGLEIGCGTGLVGLSLADVFSNLILTDSSQGMLDVVNEKLGKHPLPNVSTRRFDIETENPLYEGECDLLFSSMVFHHFKEVSSVLRKIAEMIGPGGVLLIADLLPEDGSFHQNGEEVHKGFESSYLSTVVMNSGFFEVRVNRIHTVKKMGKEYGIFLLVAQRKGIEA